MCSQTLPPIEREINVFITVISLGGISSPSKTYHIYTKLNTLFLKFEDHFTTTV